MTKSVKCPLRYPTVGTHPRPNPFPGSSRFDITFVMSTNLVHGTDWETIVYTLFYGTPQLSFGFTLLMFRFKTPRPLSGTKNVTYQYIENLLLRKT